MEKETVEKNSGKKKSNVGSGGNVAESKCRSRHSSKDQTEEEQRRRRLELKAKEWKDQQKQKERRHKKRQLIPTVYLPADGIHPLYQRHILPAISFDYAKIPFPPTPPPPPLMGKKKGGKG